MSNKADLQTIIQIAEAIFRAEGVRTADDARAILLLQAKAKGMGSKLKAILGYAKEGGLIVKEDTSDGWIELVSGRRIFIKGAENPDPLRGIALSYVALDEYADMKEDTWSVLTTNPNLED